MDSHDSRKTAAPPKKFAEMNPLEKLVFIGKVTLCLISFGFVFPHIGD